MSCWAGGSKEENLALFDTCDACRWIDWILFQGECPPLWVETTRCQPVGHADKKKPTSISEDTSIPPEPEYEIRTEPSFFSENHRHYVPESVDTLNSSSKLCSPLDSDEELEYARGAALISSNVEVDLVVLLLEFILT